MKRCKSFGFILTVFFFFHLFILSSQVLPEENAALAEIEEKIEQIDTLIEERQFEKAIAIGEETLEKAKNVFRESDPTVARVLNSLGECYSEQANYEKSEPLLKQALAIRKKAYGLEHPDVAESLNALGILYKYQSKYTEAESILKQALAMREKLLGPEHSNVASSLNDIANLYFMQCKYAAAEPLLKQALGIRKKALGPQHAMVAKTLSNLGKLYFRQRKYPEAEGLLKQALNIQKKTLGPRHHDLTGTYTMLAGTYAMEGEYSKAEPFFKLALEIEEKVLGPEHPNVATMLSNLAHFYSIEGKYNKVEPLLKRALNIQEKTTGPSVAMAVTLSNLAFFYSNQGKYQEAERLYRRSAAIWEKIVGPDAVWAADPLDGLALIYTRQEKFHNAESFLKRSLNIREKAFGQNHPEVAISLAGLANLYLVQGKYEEAEPLFKKTLVIFDKAPGTHHTAMLFSQESLASLYHSQGKYQKAEHLLNQVLTAKEKTMGPNHPETGASMEKLAILYGSFGKTDKSLALYNNFHKSRQHFIEYAFSYASEDQKMRYIEKYPLLNHSLLSYALINNKVDPNSMQEVTEKIQTALRCAALEMALKAKGVVIDAVLAEKEIAFCSYDEAIRKKAEKHAQVCGEISTLTLAGVNKLDPEIYRDRLQTLYQEKDALETELSNSCAEFKDELAMRRFKIPDVVHAIPEGSVLWEFIRYEPYDFKKTGSDTERTGPPRYLAFTLDHEEEITLTDLGEAEAIDQLIHSARERLYKAREEAYFPVVIQSEKQLNGVTTELYDTIFAPLASSLGDRTDILISPDGQLNLLPFEIFPCPDGQYVIEKYRISYLSSGRDLLRFKKEQESTDWAMVMADPAFNLAGEALAAQRDKTLNEPEVSPVLYAQSRGVSGCFDNRFTSLRYSRRETVSVVQALEDQARLKARYYCGGDALEEVLKGMSGAPRVLHLATHGFFCEDVEIGIQGGFENPLLRCGLALTGANCVMDKGGKDESRKEDGILTAFEQKGLNLVGTELVTLSACETGVGEVKNGEGVYGLRRAFQHAGARSIMMSLWKVRDRETCELMEGFYQNWLGGQSKREALRQSALKILASQREKHQAGHPYLWGAFVLLGDPD